MKLTINLRAEHNKAFARLWTFFPMVVYIFFLCKDVTSFPHSCMTVCFHDKEYCCDFLAKFGEGGSRGLPTFIRLLPDKVESPKHLISYFFSSNKKFYYHWLFIFICDFVQMLSVAYWKNFLTHLNCKVFSEICRN